MNLRQKCKKYKYRFNKLQKELEYIHDIYESITLVPFGVEKKISRETLSSPDVNYPNIMLENRLSFEKALFNHIHEHLDDYVNIIVNDDIFDGSKRLLYKVDLRKVKREEPTSFAELAVGNIGEYTFPMHVEFGPIYPSLSVDEDPWKDDRRY